MCQGTVVAGAGSVSLELKPCSTLLQASASSAFPSTATEAAPAEESARLGAAWALRSRAHQEQAVPNQSRRLSALCTPAPATPVLQQHGQGASWCRAYAEAAGDGGRGQDSVTSGPCLSTAAVILAGYFCSWLVQAQAVNLLQPS